VVRFWGLKIFRAPDDMFGDEEDDSWVDRR